MSAKAVKRSPAPAKIQDGLVGSLQHEVASEASPLLGFLVSHAATIAVGIIVFIAAIGGYWFYQSQSDGKRTVETAELGKIMIISDPTMRMERLEAFLENAPESTRRSVWFAIIDTASALEDNERLYRAWKAVSEMDATIRLPAMLGMANALTAQEKYKEALDLLVEAAASPPGSESAQINIRIATLAEMQGDYARAIQACDAVIGDPLLDPVEVTLWSQKRTALAAMPAAGSSGPAKQAN